MRQLETANAESREVRPQPVDDTPMMKSLMPCQVAYPEIISNISDAMPISVLRPSR
jgi:hypothetical protein